MALLVILTAFGLVASGCAEDSDSAASSTTGSSATAVPTEVTGEITVSAAASLKETFTEIGSDFEADNPGSKVTINFGSSGDLATQIQGGAPVDVAAFAAESNMLTLDDDGILAGGADIFATNKLVMVTKPGNPQDVQGLADLATAGIISLCADTAPCGKYANQVLADAGVVIPADRITRGQDVRATLNAVTHGDAVAGIVYVTDAATAGDEATSVGIPDDQNAVARYPIAVVKSTAEAETATAFMDFVLGPRGQKVLRTAGFGAP